MLTLILKSKLGFNAEEVALWFLVFGFIDVPFKLLGGKLTDRFNKRDTIIVCDLISVVMYVTTAFLPLSMGSLIVYFIGSAFQHMEWPAYDSIIAEMTSDDDRQKAYSLQYLASNLGVVFAPTLGGLLFNNYLWLSFLICGLAVLSSTILIFLFIPKTFKKAITTNTYEENEEGNVFQMLMGRKILLAYVVVGCVAHMIYS
jgi:predicted MFS family arabinose efflux permease